MFSSPVGCVELLELAGFDSPREEWEQGRPDHALMYSEAIDCFEWAVSRPLEHPPGAVGRYRNCDPLSLGYLVRQTVEANHDELGEYLSYPQRHLFDKLGQNAIDDIYRFAGIFQMTTSKLKK